MIEFEHKTTINKEELKSAIENDNVKVIEVLPEKEYEKEHIKGAINIELAQIRFKAPRLFEKGDNIVVYCTDADCLASPTAARILREIGFTNVMDYEEGKTGWKQAGYPMESCKAA